MWLHIPPPQSRSAVELGASTSGCAWPCLGSEPSSTANMTSLPLGYSRSEWQRAISAGLLSGLTCEPSAVNRCATAWAQHWAEGGRPSSTEESPASLTRSQAVGLARLIHETYGRPRLNSWRRWTPGEWRLKECLSKTLPGLFPEDSSPELPATCPLWVAELRQRSSALRQLGRLMAVNDFSSSESENWMTPSASPIEGANCSGDGRTRPNKLSWEAEAWRSPTAQVSRSGRFNDQAVIQRRISRGHMVKAAEQGRLWRTPSASDGEGGTMSIATATARGLNPKIKLRDDGPDWSTPRFSPHKKVADARSRSGGEPCRKSHDLRRWCWLRRRVQAGRTAVLVQRLNPAFCEWLMGWPIGWTDEKRAFDRSEMALYHSRLHRQFVCWLGLSTGNVEVGQ